MAIIRPLRKKARRARATRRRLYIERDTKWHILDLKRLYAHRTFERNFGSNSNTNDNDADVGGRETRAGMSVV